MVKTLIAKEISCLQSHINICSIIAKKHSASAKKPSPRLFLKNYYLKILFRIAVFSGHFKR